jgi:hypothetical protein
MASGFHHDILIKDSRNLLEFNQQHANQWIRVPFETLL